MLNWNFTQEHYLNCPQFLGYHIKLSIEHIWKFKQNQLQFNGKTFNFEALILFHFNDFVCVLFSIAYGTCISICPTLQVLF